MPMSRLNSLASTETTILPRCYTVREIAESLKVSEETVRRMFRDIPGVVKLTKGRRLRSKREFVTLRIPETVLSTFLLERSR